MTDADKTVILRKKVTKESLIEKGQFVKEKKIDGGKNKQTTININKNKLENDEDFKLPVVTYELKMALQQARQKNKLTQKELAQKTCIPVKYIQDYENGKGIITSEHLAKINRVLGTSLKKPKVKKHKDNDDSVKE